MGSQLRRWLYLGSAVRRFRHSICLVKKRERETDRRRKLRNMERKRRGGGAKCEREASSERITTNQLSPMIKKSGDRLPAIISHIRLAPKFLSFPARCCLHKLILTIHPTEGCVESPQCQPQRLFVFASMPWLHRRRHGRFATYAVFPLGPEHIG